MKRMTCLILILLSVLVVSCSQFSRDRSSMRKNSMRSLTISESYAFIDEKTGIKTNTPKEVEVYSKEYADSVINEGYEMYYLERASWISTDILTAKYKSFDKIEGYSGYVTYKEDNRIISVYKKTTNGISMIFATFTFNYPTDETGVIENYQLREMNSTENHLFKFREEATTMLSKIPYYSIPSDCGINFVYLPIKRGLRMYALTASHKSNQIPFGNDIYFEFDTINKCTLAFGVHRELSADTGVVFPMYSPVENEIQSDGTAKSVAHIHYASVPIAVTPSDICNFLLYGKSDYFFVISRETVSVFNSKNRKECMILPASAFKELEKK